MRNKKFVLICTMIALLFIQVPEVSANASFSLNSYNPTYTAAQKKLDSLSAVANVQSGLQSPWASVRLDVITDAYYNGYRESATAPVTANNNTRYYLGYYAGYGTPGMYYRLDSWSYSGTSGISGIWAP